MFKRVDFLAMYKERPAFELNINWAAGCKGATDGARVRGEVNFLLPFSSNPPNPNSLLWHFKYIPDQRTLILIAS